MKASSKTSPATPAVSYAEITQRPLQSLVFLLPLLLLYEVGSFIAHPSLDPDLRTGLAAPQLLRAFLGLFGAQGVYLPGFFVVAVLLGWHLVARQRWQVNLRATPVMLAESLLWAVPLVLINNLIRLTALAAADGSPDLLDELILSIGAGIYEEMVFRLMVISIVMSLAVDVWRVRPMWASAAAVVISSLLFAAHHYPPIGTDEFHRADFAFRVLSGGYLAAVFLNRGFGIAVGAHAAYNIIVVALL